MGDMPKDAQLRRFENLYVFLDMVSRGCISGNVSEWPQLKPACGMAVGLIKELLRENNRLKNALLPLAEVAERADSSNRKLPDTVGLWTHVSNDENGNYVLMLGHARTAKALLDSWDGRTW